MTRIIFLAALLPSVLVAQQPAEVFVQAGTFVRGGKDIRKFFLKTHPSYNTQDEKPQHPTRLTKPFYLGKHEVTVAEFRAFVNETNYQTTAEKNGKGIRGFDPRKDRQWHLAFSQKSEFSWKSPGFDQQDNYPVVGVSWQDAQAYCRWLSQKSGKKYRLPTSTEWEYACRAGSDDFFSWGDEFLGTIHQKANIGNVELEKAHTGLAQVQWLFDIANDPGDPHVYTSSVGSYPANAWNLHDMHGNVWEWCEDVYLDTEYTAYKRPNYDKPLQRAVDPLNTKAMNDFGDWRVIRGGSWFTSPIQSRAAVRSFFEATEAACYLGFRVARDASADEVAAARRAFEEEENARQTVKQAIGEFRSREGPDTRAEFRQPPDRSVSRLLSKLPEVTTVNINGNGRLDGGVFEDIASMSRVKFLQIHNPGDQITADHFVPFSRTNGLEEVRFTYSNHLDDAALAHFASHRDVKSVHIESQLVTDEGLRVFANMPQLKYLSAIATKSNGSVLQHMTDLPLRTIRIEGMTSQTANHLSTFSNLESLTLQRGTMTDLSCLSNLTKLTRLDIEQCEEIPDASFQALKELRLLQFLELNRTKAGDQAVEAMSQMQQIEHLRLGSPNLSDRGLRGICDLLTLTVLTIDPDATEITDRGFIDFWRLNRLNTLTISAPNVTGKGFAPLTELNLNHLRVSNAALTDEGLAFISEILSLQTLTIGTGQSGPPAITDDALLLLKDISKLRSIELYRKDTQITDEGIAKLREALPNCQINLR